MPARTTDVALPLPVWIWFEYPDRSPARYIQLNLQALQRNAPSSHFAIHFVNHSNIASLVPDLPDVFWRLPTRIAFSDAARLALLATHGGIYLDADFLVLRSLVPVAQLLQTVDIVGYPFSVPHGTAETAAECARSGRISANFLAARPNATLFRRAWDSFRQLLPRRCNSRIQRKIYICCRDAATNKPLHSCRVPHATTDLMMSRVRTQIWPEQRAKASSSAGTASGAVADDLTTASSVHCYGGSQDLTTPRLRPTDEHGAELQDSLHSVLGLPLTALRVCFGKWKLLSRQLGCEICPPDLPERFRVCCWRSGDDLVCRQQAAGVRVARASGFYAPTRLAYHLFDSLQKRSFLAQTEIEWSNLTVAPLYRRALGLPE